MTAPTVTDAIITKTIFEVGDLVTFGDSAYGPKYGRITLIDTSFTSIRIWAHWYKDKALAQKDWSPHNNSSTWISMDRCRLEICSKSKTI